MSQGSKNAKVVRPGLVAGIALKMVPPEGTLEIVRSVRDSLKRPKETNPLAWLSDCLPAVAFEEMGLIRCQTRAASTRFEPESVAKVVDLSLSLSFS